MDSIRIIADICPGVEPDAKASIVEFENIILWALS
jgi:hypothetical protein